MLNRDAILQADDLVREEVLVPEWGDAVHVRTMTGIERDSYEEACLAATQDGRTDIKGMRVRLLLMTLCDKDGRAFFTADDAEVLGSKSAAVLDRLFQVALRINGLTEEAIEDEEGNSSGDQDSNSGSS